MSGTQQTAIPPRRGAGGYVMVMALLILAVLFVLGSSFLSLMQGESQIAVSDRDLMLALNAAEAGVQQALRNAKAAASLTTLLLDSTPNTGKDGSGTLQRDVRSGTLQSNVTYGFSIANDPAESGTTTDNNSMIMITSWGRVANATRIIELVTYIPKLPGFPAAIYAPGTEGDSSFSGVSLVVDGHDTDPVTENPTGGVTKLGVGAGSVAVRNTIYNALSNAERTRPVFQGTAGDYAGQPSLGVDATLTSAQVATMAAAYGSFASPQNTVQLSAGGSLSIGGRHEYANGSLGGPNSSNNQGWGTRTSPNLYKISGNTQAQYNANNAIATPTLNISGDFEGAGILILDGAYLNISGNFRWEGIIIVTGPKIGISVGGGGNQKIFGTVMVNETGASRCGSAICDELILLGNPTLYYSQTAINNASRALGARVTYWNERGT